MILYDVSRTTETVGVQEKVFQTVKTARCKFSLSPEKLFRFIERRHRVKTVFLLNIFEGTK